MVAIGLLIAGLALIVSVVFNVLQYRWREEDKAEQKRKEEEKETERRRKEQAPPDFYNLGGNPGPILVSGKRTSTQGKFVDVWGLVTVVNRTQTPIKITPLRLVLAGEEWPYQNISFHVKSNTQLRSDRISLRGNDKEDYELHFMFPDNKCPTHDAELWLESDNRAEQFPVPVRFP
jgi:hypothetical protein